MVVLVLGGNPRAIKKPGTDAVVGLGTNRKRPKAGFLPRGAAVWGEENGGVALRPQGAGQAQMHAI